jgi:hypothetical protein
MAGLEPVIVTGTSGEKWPVHPVSHVRNKIE